MLALLYILFPLAAFSGIFLFLGSRCSFGRLVLLRSALLFSAYLIFLLEFLSLFAGVTRLGLTLGWLLPAAALGAYFYLRRRQGLTVQLPVLRFPRSWSERLLAFLILGVAGITLLTAWLSPPVTYDSLTYHLSRVAHWSQNQSIHHYITGIERQNSMGIGAEIHILNAYVLTGSDRLAAFPQWLAMLGSLVAVSLIAKSLEAKPFEQWLAALIAATLPMGIAQASSTITDYVTAFFVVCAAVEVLLYQTRSEPRAPFYAALAAALAILTKATAVPFLLPFAAWLAVLMFKRMGFVQAAGWGIAALLMVSMVNAGYLGRNLITYRHLSNPADFALHRNETHTPKVVLSNLLRNAGVHAGLPYLTEWNELVYLNILKLHNWMRMSMDDPRTTAIGVFNVHPPPTNEDLIINPVHAYLFLGAFVLSAPFYRRMGSPALLYLAVVAATFVLYSYFFKWQIFAPRLQLPFFVLFAPGASALVSRLDKRNLLGALVAVGLVASSFPWMVWIDSRPLLSRPETQPSILSQPRDLLYFAGDIEFYQAVNQLTGEVKSLGCSQVGLMLWGEDPEYLFWRFFDAPHERLRIEWIVAGTPSARYRTAGFSPCAIVCRDCDVSLPLRGLPFQGLYKDYQLFVESGPAGE